MQDTKASYVVNFMIRHFLLANISDPLSDDSRGYSPYTLKFSGTNTTGQINYFDRKFASGSVPVVKVNDVVRTPTVDYVIDTTNLTLTWTAAYTPPTGTDNIEVTYQAIKPWIIQDYNYVSNYIFPLVQIDEVNIDYKNFQVGEYYNYASGAGNWVKNKTKIIVRNRQNSNAYDYDGIYLKNMDLVSQIAEEIKIYFKTNTNPAKWQFYRWNIENVQRVRTEEDKGILRKDLDAELIYFDNTV